MAGLDDLKSLFHLDDTVVLFERLLWLEVLCCFTETAKESATQWEAERILPI